MTEVVDTAAKDLRALREEALSLINRTPDRAGPGSPRYAEDLLIESESPSSAKDLLQLLDLLDADLQLQAMRVLLLVDGLADCIEMSDRRAGQYNGEVASAASTSTSR